MESFSELFLSVNENSCKRAERRTYLQKYDSAKTPYRRCLESDKISDEVKSKLRQTKAKLNKPS